MEIFNLIPPRGTSYMKILFRTKLYYHLRRLTDVVENDTQGYYVFIRKKNIQIKIIDDKKETIEKVEKYLDYAFENSYLGIQKKDYDILQFEKVRKIQIWQRIKKFGNGVSVYACFCY